MRVYPPSFWVLLFSYYGQGAFWLFLCCYHQSHSIVTFPLKFFNSFFWKKQELWRESSSIFPQESTHLSFPFCLGNLSAAQEDTEHAGAETLAQPSRVAWGWRGTEDWEVGVDEKHGSFNPLGGKATVLSGFVSHAGKSLLGCCRVKISTSEQLCRYKEMF